MNALCFHGEKRELDKHFLQVCTVFELPLYFSLLCYMFFYKHNVIT